MPQQIAKLRATIAELERELDSLSELDDETRALLTEAAGELQEALSRHPDHIRHPVLTDRLQSAAEEFKTSHPTLFGIVTRMVDSLAQLGIEILLASQSIETHRSVIYTARSVEL